MKKQQRDNFLISFFKEKEKYKILAEYLVRLISDDPSAPKESIHMILHRIKDESRLIEKIDQENISSEFDMEPITHKNFHERIGDIIGIRIICLRLSDIVKVEKYLEFLVEENRITSYNVCYTKLLRISELGIFLEIFHVFFQPLIP